MAVWLTPNKEGTYAGLRPQKGKDGGSPDPWNVHVSFDEMVWTEADGQFSISMIVSAATGHSVARDSVDKVKFPFPVSIKLDSASTEPAEACIMKVLKAKSEAGKCYSGFIKLDTSNVFSGALASGKKADGTPLADMEVSLLSEQFASLMEVQKSKLSDELISQMSKKAYSGGRGYGGGSGETKAEQIKAREAALKGYLGCKPEASFAEVLSEVAMLSTGNSAAMDLIKILLA